MKKILNEKMEVIEGGDFIEGVCGGLAFTRGAMFLFSVAVNPVVGGAFIAAGVGCAIYGLSNN